MCLMAPGRVLSRGPRTCDVDTAGRVDQVSHFLAPEVEVGDWVLVNGGTIVRRLDPQQAAEMTRAYALLFSSSMPDELVST